ncbi:ABC transporter permease [Candidatus Tenderia electrophaga]|jgi:putative ABC transport system permease protein|uniref:ABC transporter permease n=1 Tax=Candidatus Tenderia electrophaga TaxID=1748243 RepID=A0A0S2TH45_9GAMM|nr:ABC transporter permease [Candidatus Tenderia electrophaga]
MTMITLSWWDVAIAALLVLLLAGLSVWQRLALHKQILIAGVRTVVQLALVGLILELIFADARLLWVVLMAVVMLAVAGYETMARQTRRLGGGWAYGIGTVSLFTSSFTVALFALLVIIGNEPWYQPQYAIPLLGMMLGNTMNGIALSLDRLMSMAWQQRAVIEQRLMLGQHWQEAISELRVEAMRAGMIPTINAMAAVGVVSLPGMMTGQILSGTAPIEAVKYQIMIMFMVAAGAGFGTVVALHLGARRLFDERQRLRLERLHAVK